MDVMEDKLRRMREAFDQKRYKLYVTTGQVRHVVGISKDALTLGDLSGTDIGNYLQRFYDENGVMGVVQQALNPRYLLEPVFAPYQFELDED